MTFIHKPNLTNYLIPNRANLTTKSENIVIFSTKIVDFFNSHFFSIMI